MDGFQSVASIFVQSIKKPVQAMVLSLSRQIVFLIPAVVILPRYLGIDGVLWAGPLADALAFVLALVVIIVEMKKLRITGPREPAISRY